MHVQPSPGGGGGSTSAPTAAGSWKLAPALEEQGTRAQQMAL